MRNRSLFLASLLVLLCVSLATYLLVTSEARTLSVPPPQNELQVFFGNLHSHTSFSDVPATNLLRYASALAFQILPLGGKSTAQREIFGGEGCAEYNPALRTSSPRPAL